VVEFTDLHAVAHQFSHYLEPEAGFGITDIACTAVGEKAYRTARGI